MSGERGRAMAARDGAGRDPLALRFGEAIGRLHVRCGGDPGATGLVAGAAASAWSAAADGHVCVALADPPAAEALAASPACTPEPLVRPAPLVLDCGSLYLHRLWSAEASLAAALASLDSESPLAPASALEEAIAAVFDARDPADAQQRAVHAALARRFAVISGGPGTGKTTTLARMLVAFARLRPDARVAYAAPTGKAAARLAQALAEQVARLDPTGALDGRLPVAGLTVHRLLGIGRREDSGAPAPLGFDLVIVDEASMLDVGLASRLARSIPREGRLVLAGDRDQLASVEAGAVFAEVCASRLAGIVRLERNYRQKEAPAIAALAQAIRDGDAGGALAGFAAGAASAEAVAADAFAPIATLLDGIGPGADAAALLRGFDAHRVLCALREGPGGAATINRAVAALVRRRVGEAPQAEWYPGRLVIVTRNHAGIGLFNGDVGLCLPRPDGPGAAAQLAVAFPAPEGVRWVPTRQMPACDDAFAITVHKSQGSEFDAVTLVPAPAGHPLNTRELAYTGVTRARRALSIRGEPEAILEAARTRTRRAGHLAARIDELLSARTPSPSRA